MAEADHNIDLETALVKLEEEQQKSVSSLLNIVSIVVCPVYDIYMFRYMNCILMSYTHMHILYTYRQIYIKYIYIYI